MPHLAGGSHGAAVELAADDQRSPDARIDLDERSLAHAAAGSPHRLGQAPEVRVVVDVDDGADVAPHLFRSVDADPTRRDARGVRSTGRTIEGSGQTHTDAEDLF